MFTRATRFWPKAILQRVAQVVWATLSDRHKRKLPEEYWKLKTWPLVISWRVWIGIATKPRPTAMLCVTTWWSVILAGLKGQSQCYTITDLPARTCQDGPEYSVLARRTSSGKTNQNQTRVGAYCFRTVALSLVLSCLLWIGSAEELFGLWESKAQFACGKPNVSSRILKPITAHACWFLLCHDFFLLASVLDRKTPWRREKSSFKWSRATTASSREKWLGIRFDGKVTTKKDLRI